MSYRRLLSLLFVLLNLHLLRNLSGAYLALPLACYAALFLRLAAGGRRPR